MLVEWRLFVCVFISNRGREGGSTSKKFDYGCLKITLLGGWGGVKVEKMFVILVVTCDVQFWTGVGHFCLFVSRVYSCDL